MLQAYAACLLAWVLSELWGKGGARPCLPAAAAAAVRLAMLRCPRRSTRIPCCHLLPACYRTRCTNSSVEEGTATARLVSYVLPLASTRVGCCWSLTAEARRSNTATAPHAAMRLASEGSAQPSRREDGKRKSAERNGRSTLGTHRKTRVERKSGHLG